MNENIRLCEGDKPVWYGIYVQLSGKDGKMEEIAGSIKKLEINEIMSIDILDYYPLPIIR